MIRQMEKLGIKDLSRRTRFERIITPVDWETEQNVYPRRDV